MRPPTPNTSGIVQERLSALQEKVGAYLLLEDRDALPVILGAVAAHRLGGDPVWLLIVGPSSGAKTELLNLLTLVPGVFFLSDLTEHTFASGLRTDGRRNPSLLPRLTDQAATEHGKGRRGQTF